MELSLDRSDLGINIRDTKPPVFAIVYDYFDPTVQRAIRAVGKATFWEDDRSNYKVIYPPSVLT